MTKRRSGAQCGANHATVGRIDGGTVSTPNGLAVTTAITRVTGQPFAKARMNHRAAKYSMTERWLNRAWP